MVTSWLCDVWSQDGSKEDLSMLEKLFSDGFSAWEETAFLFKENRILKLVEGTRAKGRRQAIFSVLRLLQTRQENSKFLCDALRKLDEYVVGNQEDLPVENGTLACCNDVVTRAKGWAKSKNQHKAADLADCALERVRAMLKVTAGVSEYFKVALKFLSPEIIKYDCIEEASKRELLDLAKALLFQKIADWSSWCILERTDEVPDTPDRVISFFEDPNFVKPRAASIELRADDSNWRIEAELDEFSLVAGIDLFCVSKDRRLLAVSLKHGFPLAKIDQLARVVIAWMNSMSEFLQRGGMFNWEKDLIVGSHSNPPGDLNIDFLLRVIEYRSRLEKLMANMNSSLLPSFYWEDIFWTNYYEMCGRFYLRKSKLEECLDHFRKVMSGDPDHMLSRINPNRRKADRTSGEPDPMLSQINPNPRKADRTRSRRKQHPEAKSFKLSLERMSDACLQYGFYAEYVAHMSPPSLQKVKYEEVLAVYNKSLMFTRGFGDSQIEWTLWCLLFYTHNAMCLLVMDLREDGDAARWHNSKAQEFWKKAVDRKEDLGDPELYKRYRTMLDKTEMRLQSYK
jgi:hypothetical protein